MSNAASVLTASQIQMLAEDELIEIFPKFRMEALEFVDVCAVIA